MTSFVAIFTIEFLKLLRKKYRVVTDSVIQDNFAFQRFNLPRDSIHSTRLYTLIRKRRIPVSRESFPLSFLSSPLPRSLYSRYPPSRPSRVQPTVKEKFSPGNSLPAGYRCIDESLRESRGNWMTATRREVSIRWFNQLARDASLSLSPILLPPFSFLLLNGSRCSVWPGQFGSWQVRWGSYYTFFSARVA